MKVEALHALIKLRENGCDFGVHQQLGISRSDLWFLITRLEKDIGLKLVVRKKKNNTLTKEAEYFLPYAQQAIELLERGLSEASQLLALEKLLRGKGSLYPSENQSTFVKNNLTLKSSLKHFKKRKSLHLEVKAH